MTDDLFDLSGEVALVTGGNGGIGRAIVLAFARAGASVAILGRDKVKNSDVLKELRGIGRPCTAPAADIVDRTQHEPSVQQVERELGPVSLLVNNAGNASAGGLLLGEGPDA